MKFFKSRYWVLFFTMLIGFSSVWLIPNERTLRPSMLSIELPESVGDWFGKAQKVGQRELDILAKDTEFERLRYVRWHDGYVVGAIVSLVLSGQDMNNSIHRPEYCLRAQGWNFKSESYKEVKISQDGVEVSIPVKEIICEMPQYQEVELDEVGKDGKKKRKAVPVIAPNGKPSVSRRIQYYTFFGHSKVVAGHYERTFADIIDRVFKGYAQRWAYATFSVEVGQKRVDQGYSKYDVNGLDDEAARGQLELLMRDLLPNVMRQK